jgi:bifunctional DNA-binding transcriptional regulator/antitoxin component of YhaV-PrlF toxin-antitoxin module
MSKRFTVTLEEDEFGELILPIPDEVCEELGWEVGDELEYDIIDDNTFSVRKANDGNQ